MLCLPRPTWACRLALTVMVTALVSSMNSPCEARNPIRSSFFAAYPAAVGSRLDNLPSIQSHCGVCHFAFTGGGPRNPYGARIEQALPGYPNTDAGRQQAMHSIEGLDSDGDGYSQLAEITDLVSYANTPTFPGLTPGNVGSVSGVNVNEILGYLVPTTGADTEAPSVTVTSPNGAESFAGGVQHSVTWTATDNVGVTSVDIDYRDAEAAPWTPIARGLPNSGSFGWWVHNTPTTAARIRVTARDAAGNPGTDQSNALFVITAQPGGIAPTTLRDFHQPGSQPFSAGTFQDRGTCAACHGGYDASVEPDRNFQGSMMAQAARDPIFYASVAIAEQDAPSSGDLCLRCHTPFGWLLGRSNPTTGGQITAFDRDGVSCDFCHRIVDPDYKPGVSPAEDSAILAALPAGDLPLTYANGQYVVDPQPRKRGPFADALAPHPFLESPVHRTSEFCGTCHDVSNPVFTRTGAVDYAPGTFDAKAESIDSAVLMPLERTYSEWKHSTFNTPGGVYAPEFAGNRPDGIVSTCQDCHMRDVAGSGCNDPLAPIRQDLPLHDMTGGNAWVPTIVSQLYPGEVDATALVAGAARAVALLQKAALLDVTMESAGDSFRAEVTVTNRSGHKLPTGYPEGRRMWINVVARDAGGAVVYESGGYDPGTGVLEHDPDATIYEAELGISPALGGVLGQNGGPSFHFTLNDTIYRDNRIPPLGFTNAAFAVFGGVPVDPEHGGPGPRYADGQNWDVASYGLPASARSVVATLYYQTISKEFIDFLRDENSTNTAGQLLFDVWSANGRAAPVAMAADTAAVEIVAVADPGAAAQWAFQAVANPFAGTLEMRIVLPRASAVRCEIYDLQGRRVQKIDAGRLEAGSHRLTWDGRDERGREAPSGVYWARVETPERSLVRRVVRIR